MNYKRMVPNSISGLSLILGVVSIFLTIAHDFNWAAIFIILAVLADSCDGRAARLLGVSGEFGKELDSLCDLCSFGVAPAILIYVYGLQELGVVGQVIAALYTFGGAMRLARFNVNAADVHGYFQGMPIPAGGCILATYVLSGYNYSSMWVAFGTLVVAYIMYSEIRYPDFKGKGNPLFLLPVSIAVLIGFYMLFTNASAWPFICMFTYTICGIFNALYIKIFNKTISA